MPAIFVPPTDPYIMPPDDFDALIAQFGQRVAWMRSHTCPCIFGGGGANGHLPLPGTAQRSCLRCFGTGTYWDDPTLPFRVWISFIQLSPTPDEPGVRVDQNYGAVQLSEPSMTLPYRNPMLSVNDPAQPTAAWNGASVSDIFVASDMLARYTAVLQVGGLQVLPYQQNIQIAPTGAVTVWDPTTSQVEQVSSYTVSGAAVTISGYPPGTNYMVEFQAAPLYVAFRPAGGVPHVRPFGGGTVAEPRRFKLQTLDFWTRQRIQQPTAAGSTTVAGNMTPFAVMSGQVQGG